MGADEVVERVLRILGPRRDVHVKRMFGGLVVMVAGRMCCGIGGPTGDSLMVRLGPEAEPAALAEPHVRPMDVTGRPFRGFVFVEPDGYRSAADLRRWVALGVAYAEATSADRPRAARPRKGAARKR